MVYDCTNTESFESLQKWIKEIDDHSAESIILFVIANKCDLSD